MRAFIRFAFVIIIIISCGVTFVYEIKHPELIPVFLAGLITRGVFGEEIKKLLDHPHHGWLYNHARLWALGEHQAFKAKDCDQCLRAVH